MAPASRRGAAPTLHELLAAPPTADLLHLLSARLRSLAEGPEGPQARAEIELALTLPYWGLRTLAIRALGRWGGRQNKRWLLARANRPMASYEQLRRLSRGDPQRWQAEETRAARTALLPLLDATDAGWLLELWFSDWLRTGRYDALMRLPPAPVAARIQQALAQPAEHTAALYLAFYHKGVPSRLDVLRHFTRSPDAELARSAQNLLRIDAMSTS